MSLHTKRKVAQALSVPLFYIKSKTPRQLLTIYKRCTRGALPFPPMRKHTFNGKIFLVPSTPLGRKTYANVILSPNPLAADMATAASRLSIKGAKGMKKNTLKQAIINKFIQLKIPEPVLFSRSRKPKAIVKIIKNSTPQPIRRVPDIFKNDIRIRTEVDKINRGISSNMGPRPRVSTNGNRTTTVRHISNKKNMGPRPRVSTNGNRTTTVRYISNKKNMAPRIPPRPRVPMNRNRTTTVRYISNKKNVSPGPKIPMGPFITTDPNTPGPGPNVPKPNKPRPNVPKPRPNVPKPKPGPNVPNTPGPRPNVPKPGPNVPNTPGPIIVPIAPEQRTINTNALRHRIGKHELKINNLKARINQKKSA